MRKILFAVIFFLLISRISFAQEISRISSISQIDSLMSSLKGNAVLVNFWASWCAPCVEEFPDLQKIRNDYIDKGLKVIFISLDFPEDFESKLKPFLKSKNVDFKTYFCDFKNPEEIMNYFDRKWDGAIPATFLIDSKGIVQQRIIGYHNYDFYQNEILKLIE